MRSTARRWTAALVVAATVTLAACSGGGGTSPASFGDAQAGPAVAAKAPSSTAGGAGALSAPSARSERDVPTTQVRIETASMVLEVPRARDVAARADRADALVARLGGRVDSDRREAGRDAAATLVLRVPPGRLAAALRGLSGLGTVIARDASTRDVTTQVADVASRVDSARRAIARLRALYDRAPRVSDVLAVERELSSRQADLEAMQARQRSLAGQVALASITLSLQTATATPPKDDPDRGGFLGGLADGWHALTRAAGATATGVGAALPFLLIALVLGAAGRMVLLRRRRPHPAAE